jgi:hypothetical protein
VDSFAGESHLHLNDGSTIANLIIFTTKKRRHAIGADDYLERGVMSLWAGRPYLLGTYEMALREWECAKCEKLMPKAGFESAHPGGR